MTLEVALVFVVVFLFMFFTYMRYKTGMRIFNLVSVGLSIFIIMQYTSTAVIISMVGAMIWLLYDTFLGGL